MNDIGGCANVPDDSFAGCPARYLGTLTSGRNVPSGRSIQVAQNRGIKKPTITCGKKKTLETGKTPPGKMPGGNIQ